MIYTDDRFVQEDVLRFEDVDCNRYNRGRRVPVRKTMRVLRVPQKGDIDGFIPIDYEGVKSGWNYLCDQIYEMADGRIIANGTFDELQQSSASFREMALIESE